MMLVSGDDSSGDDDDDNGLCNHGRVFNRANAIKSFVATRAQAKNIPQAKCAHNRLYLVNTNNGVGVSMYDYSHQQTDH